MKKYFINLSDTSLQQSLSSAIGAENITTNKEDKSTLIDDITFNSFIANLFNRSNGVLVIGSYNKSLTSSLLRNSFSGSTLLPYFCNLGKNKEVFLNGDGFFILNPGMNLDLIDMLKPSIVILTGILSGKKGISEQSEVYEKAIRKASVGIVINDDCPEASIYKDINPNTLLYSMNKKGDILCKDYKADLSGMHISINKETYTTKLLGKDGIASVLASIATTDLLGFDKERTKKHIEAFSPPLNNLRNIGSVAGITIINDNSIYPSQVAKNLIFLKSFINKLLIIFTPDPEYYDDNYTESFLSLSNNALVAICGDGNRNKYYETIAKNLRKEGVDAVFYPSSRDTIKNIITKANYGDAIVLIGHKDKDFDNYCNNLWITLESKVI